MRAQAPTRSNGLCVRAFERAVPQRPVRGAPARDTSKSNFTSSSRQAAVDFAKVWLPQLHAQAASLDRTTSRLTQMQQAVSSRPPLHPAVPPSGPGLKFTAALTHAHHHSSSSRIDSSFHEPLPISSIRVSGTDLGLTQFDVALSSSSGSNGSSRWFTNALYPNSSTEPSSLTTPLTHKTLTSENAQSAALQGSSQGFAGRQQGFSSLPVDQEVLELQQLLEGTAVLKAEVDGLLSSCMMELTDLLGSAVNSSNSSSGTMTPHTSNIVPWAPTANSASPATTATITAAAAAAVDIHPAATAAPTDAAATAATADAVIPSEQLVVVYHKLPAGSHSSDLSSTSNDSIDPFGLNTTVVTLPAAAAAAAATAVGEEVLPPAAAAASSGSPAVQYLRLPQQQQQYEAAVQQGLLVVPLPGALNRQSDGMSLEELAWINQEAGCWGMEQQEQPEELFSTAATATAAADDAGDAAAAAAAVVAAVSAEATAAVAGGVVVGDKEEASNGNATTVKVDVGVHLATKPGQRVLLVGSHPTLGSWDLSRAWKLKWSDGHIWRGCLELPADSRGIEFKAVLKSAEAIIWERGNNRSVKLQGTDRLALQYAFQA